MANKRMFSMDVITDDEFLDLPHSSQLLYFHICMHADDDGFNGSVKSLIRTIGVREDDVKLLIAKGFLICFPNNVVVVTHWRQHNTLKGDRYHSSKFTEERKQLYLQENRMYTLDSHKGYPLGLKQNIIATSLTSDLFVNALSQEPAWNQSGTCPESIWNQNGTNVEPSVLQSGIFLEPETRLDKTREDKDRIGKDSFNNSTINSIIELMSDEECDLLAKKMDNSDFLRLIDEIDEKNKANCFVDIIHPYNYCLQVGKNKGYIR